MKHLSALDIWLVLGNSAVKSSPAIMFYYTVLPLEKIRTEKFPAFTYCFKKEIPLFSLVRIPLRKKNVSGIIWQKTNRPSFLTKPIQKVLEENFLQENQVILAQKISDYYLFPFNETLKLFFPPQIRKRNQKEKLPSEMTNKILLREKLSPTSDQKQAIKKILQNSINNFLLFGPASSGKTLVAWEIASKIIQREKQILVILPETFLAQQEKERWQKKLGLGEEEIFFVHSAQKKTTYRQSWEKIRQGKIKLIIGSRSGLFLPFSKLGLIVVDEQQDSSHRQWDKPPFFDARKLAEYLAKISSAQLLFLSSTPTPEIYFDNKFKKIFLPRLKTKKWQIQKPTILLTDLKKNFFDRQHSSLTEELKKQLQNTFEKNQLAFILVPQRGFGQKIFCIDCRKNLKCPHCQTNLVDLGENYRCLRCGYQLSSITACPYCHSFRLKSLGLGTEKIAQEIKTLFPNKKIFIADGKFFQKESAKEKTWIALKNREIDILVGTQTISKGFDLPFLNLVAVLAAENMVGKNNFRFDEKKLGLLFQLSGRINRPESDQKGIAVIQTFHPENPDWKNLQTMDWLAWLKKEKENRRATVYPPFCFLSKLMFIHEKIVTVEKATEKMYTELSQKEFKKSYLSLTFSVSQPQPFRKKWRKTLLLKTSKPLCQIKNLKIFLQKEIAKGNWEIEIDPENIF